MHFLRSGYPLMALSGVSAVAVLAVSVWRRSWGLWLLGFALFAVAVCVAFSFRVQSGASGAMP